MEKALFPLKYMKQTQGVNGEYSHKGTNAIDYGTNGEYDNVYAPFTGIIKKIYTEGGNVVWLESANKVLWADGTIDYMTVLTAHDNDVSDLQVGDIIKQGEIYYQYGNAGTATGIHVHLEVGKGKFNDNGWHQNNYDKWVINNSVHPATAFFIQEDTIIENDGGYNWRKVIGNPIGRDYSKNQIEVLIHNLRCRKSPNGKILGYINSGIYNILSKKHNGLYDWYQVGSNMWIAYNSKWAKLYLKSESNEAELKEKIINLEAENNSLKEEIANLQSENQALSEKINDLELENQQLKEKNSETPKEDNVNFSYVCSKTDKYVIKLYKGEILYIKDSE